MLQAVGVRERIRAGAAPCEGFAAGCACGDPPAGCRPSSPLPSLGKDEWAGVLAPGGTDGGRGGFTGLVSRCSVVWRYAAGAAIQRHEESPALPVFRTVLDGRLLRVLRGWLGGWICRKLRLWRLAGGCPRNLCMSGTGRRQPVGGGPEGRKAGVVGAPAGEGGGRANERCRVGSATRTKWSRPAGLTG